MNRIFDTWNGLEKQVVETENIHVSKSRLDNVDMETGQQKHGSVPVIYSLVGKYTWHGLE